MIDKFENFILEYTESNNYLDYYDDVINFLNINNQNIQNLLINKKINFKKVTYYSEKNNKLLHEFIDNQNFTKYIIYMLKHIYKKNKKYNFIDNTLINLYPKINNIVNELNENGCSIIKKGLDLNKCNMILEKLNNKIFINRSKNITKNIKLYDNNKNIWWLNDYKNLINLDIVQNIITSDYLLKIAEDYLNCNPILHNVLFWASYPGNVETTQQFHQDYDDIKFLKVFIYLNDVDDNNGPHSYVKKSLNNINLIKTNSGKLSERYDDELVNKHYSNNIINIKGEAGTIIFEDTHGLHKGSNVKKGKRFVLQLVYGSSTYYHLKNSNYEKYECNIKDHHILYKKFLDFPYNFMNFTFYK